MLKYIYIEGHSGGPTVKSQTLRLAPQAVNLGLNIVIIDLGYYMVTNVGSLSIG